MKTKLLFSVILFFSIKSFSQSITLTFNGLQLGSEDIHIENITNGTSTTLIGENSITLTSGSVENLLNDDIAKVYPNPFIDEVFISFYAFNDDIFNISVTNQIGKTVLQQKIKMQNGANKLKFQAPKSGLFFININSETEEKSFSVICEKVNNNSANLTLINNSKVYKTYNKSVNGLTFTIGDVLKYTGNNNNVLSIISDAPSSSKTYTFLYDCIDYENNAYSTTKVGNQWWMAENLKSAKYSNGSNVSGSYVYNNNFSNEDIYGRLYTWAAVMHGADGTNDNPSGVHGVCPTGWHVPSEIEWDELRDALGGKIPMHGKVKEVGTTHWLAPNSDALDEVGFSVLPGGLMWDGDSQYIGEQAFFWNATDDLSGLDVEHASGYTFFNETSDYYMYTWNLKAIAQSVRCVKD